MQDSFTCAIIPLSSDNTLQDKYVTFLGHVRLGRLMEDMDLFAGKYSKNFISIFDVTLKMFSVGNASACQNAKSGPEHTTTIHVRHNFSR